MRISIILSIFYSFIVLVSSTTPNEVITSNEDIIAKCRNDRRVCIQKCCGNGEIYKTSKTNPEMLKCEHSDTTNKWLIVFKTFDYYYISKNNNISLIINKANKNRLTISINVTGIQENSMSAVSNVGILPFGEYCVEFLSSDGKRIEFFSLVDQRELNADKKHASLYVPFMLVSTVAYFCSSLVYIFVLNVDMMNNKKCIIGYTMTMGFSFLFLVIGQNITKTDYVCQALGILFLLFTISGFIWITFLCIDLMLDIMYFEHENQSKTLFVTYVIISIVIPGIVGTSWSSLSGIPKALLPPDLGNSACSDESSDLVKFFVPTGFALCSSLICICISIYFMKRNNSMYSTHYLWLEKRSKYKYMAISCSLIWLTLTIWILKTGITLNLGLVINGLDFIEALQGIFVLLIFVSDRYTRKELFKKCQRSVSPSGEMIENQLSTQFASTRQK